MTEFWEKTFKAKQEMWGFQPALSTVLTKELFMKREVKNVLIPGIGYGRNAAIFIDIGMTVTGIEISSTAIELARKHYGDNLNVFHGSVGDMPFYQVLYDGIFCYALIHLLNKRERTKFIKDCYNQLSSDGYMVIIAVSKASPMYGKGIELSKDRFKTAHGVNLFFYDEESIEKEFGRYGLMEAREISEPAIPIGDRPSQKFWQITCIKR